MKNRTPKRFRRALCVLFSALLLLPLAACSAKDAAMLTDGERRVELVGGFWTPKTVRVVDARTGEEIWSESVKIDRSVRKLGKDWGLQCVDLNFDGRNDLLVATDVSGERTKQLCFLQQEDGGYLRSDDLSGLCNLHADPASRSVLSYSESSESVKSALNGKFYRVDTDSVVQFLVEGNRVTPWKSVSLVHYTENDLYCYSIAYWDEDARSFSSPDDLWLSAEDYAAQDWSFFYYFR